jgi:hypothetical protein
MTIRGVKEMLSILADSLMIATHMGPAQRDLRHNYPSHMTEQMQKRRWYQFAGLRG